MTNSSRPMQLQSKLPEKFSRKLKFAPSRSVVFEPRAATYLHFLTRRWMMAEPASLLLVLRFRPRSALCRAVDVLTFGTQKFIPLMPLCAFLLQHSRDTRRYSKTLFEVFFHSCFVVLFNAECGSVDKYLSLSVWLSVAFENSKWKHKGELPMVVLVAGRDIILAHFAFSSSRNLVSSSCRASSARSRVVAFTMTFLLRVVSYSAQFM